MMQIGSAVFNELKQKYLYTRVSACATNICKVKWGILVVLQST